MSNQTKTETAHDPFAIFELQEVGALDLKLPNGKPMLHNGQQVRVHVFSPASDQGVRLQQEIERGMVTDVARAVSASAKREDEIAEEAESGFSAKRLAAITSHFENFDYPGGPLAIYRNPRLAYIARQVRNFWNSETNFFKG